MLLQKKTITTVCLQIIDIKPNIMNARKLLKQSYLHSKIFPILLLLKKLIY